MASFALSAEWDEWPWISRVGALLLIPICWCFTIVGCWGDETFRRFCLVGGAIFLGVGLAFLLAEGATWEVFSQGALALGTGPGLLIAAAVGRACRVDSPNPVP
ncbi:hypothetical protein [Paludisphaera sp.]|uniref:hypothetical protein n=1 Tax=Paludisphaera sp. TaxID=2017432 RepID=UPI00301C537C